LQSKYDPELAAELTKWVSSIIGEDLPCTGDKKEFHTTFRNGVVLCKLANAIKPQSVKKINQGNSPFVFMGNIEGFLNTIKKMGVPDQETFQTTELVEGTNLYAVQCCLYSLGRKWHKIRHSRDSVHSEAKAKTSGDVIGLQMGSNKGATQSGQSFGNTRHM
ncbi:PREDICTED: muscle-specific protein 20-like, partial [Priapulus caudatus]|uniref:Transgelin n=1 Tax=Priapulus caudatus TaxID=37621 RepID=A0ABM1EZS7_PRICU